MGRRDPFSRSGPAEPDARASGASARRPAEPLVLPLRRLWGYNPADVIAIAYLGILSTVIVIGHARNPHWAFLLGIHLVLLCGVALLRLVPRIAPQPLQFLRESYVLLLMPAAYKDVEVVNRIVTDRYYDPFIQRFDLAVFGGHPNAWLAHALPVPALSEALHFCYLAYVLLVPILGFTLYLRGRVEVFRVFATTVAFTMYSCYLIFIFFPVRGPYYTFPPLNLPGFFPAVVRAYLKGAAVGAAFPSSHVANAITVAVMGHRFSRRLSYALIAMAIGIAVATVYGGFHYAIDALCGLVFGLTGAFLGPQLHAALLRRNRLGNIHFRFPHLRFSWKNGRMQGRVVGTAGEAERA